MKDATKKIHLHQPIFIIGSGRSGTSLMREILRAHPNIFVPKEETTFIYRIWGNRNYINESLSKKNVSIEKILFDFFQVNSLRNKKLVWDINFEEIVGDLEKINPQNMNDLFQSFVETILQKHNKQYWGDKTPRHTFVINHLYDLYPNGNFIFLVRDGRAVAASMYKKFYKETGHKFWDTLSLYRMAIGWRFSMDSMQRFEERNLTNKIFKIKFENLTNRPEEELKKLLKQLEIPFDKQMLDIQYSNSGFKNVQSKQLTGGISKTHSNWKDVINTSDKEIIINHLLYKHLNKNNYEVEKTHLSFKNNLTLILLQFLGAYDLLKIRTTKIFIKTGYNKYFRKVLGYNSIDA